MRLCFLILVFVSVTCNGQEPDTLIYIDRAEHEAAMNQKNLTIDSLQNLLDACRELQETDNIYIVADTFRVELQDARIKTVLNKQGHNVWFDLEDGSKRLNADYERYTRKILLMDSTYTVGSLFIK